jgi:hypothetical protein
MSKILKRPMFRRGGFADTGIMEGFSNGGGVTDEQLGKGAGMPATFGAQDMLGLARQEAAQPTNVDPVFTRREMEDEPLMGLSDYASLFKLGAGIASAPGRGSGLGGVLAAAGPSLQTAADEFAASQRAKAERKRAFEEKEDAREDTFKEARRGEEFQTGLLREEFDLKTTLEKLKIELDPPDAIVRLRQAEPLQAELANAKTRKEQIYATGTPKEKRDILLEIRNLQNQIAGVMGQAVDVGELDDRDRRRIESLAEDEALALLELDDIPESGEELREYNQLAEEIRQYKIVEELIILTQGATFAEGGRVGLANGGGPFEPGSGPDPDPGSPPIMRGDSPMLTFEELRARLPREVSDQVVRLIATSEAALLDFANIDTQEDIAIFNQKYNVDLQLPTQVA